MLIRDIIPPKIKKLKPIPPAILILALILQIVGGVLFLPPIEEAQADGENWLTGWNYRRPITITNPQTDFQTKVEIQGTDSEGANYVDFGKVLTDGADIRFTNSGGSSELYYWIENWNDGSGSEAATIWVRTDATTATPMYMYYGNSVSTTSNGTNTFEFFDDFEDEYIVDWDYSSLGFCCKANPVYIADIDNNGEKEIILTDAGSNEGTNRIVVLNHNGTQRWAYNGEDAAVEPPWDALALADVNEDGFQEIIFVSDKVYVLDKDGNEVWTYDLNLSCAGVTASDIDGDGHVEVVVMFERAAGGYVEIIDYQGNQKHRYNATGTLDHYTCGHTIQAFPLDPGSSHKYIVFADVGHANTLKVLKSDATLQFSYAPGTDDDWDWFDYGHLNEGIETYQVVGIFSGGRLSVLNLNGTVYWEKTDLSHPQNVQVADLDNDGHLEVGVWEKFSYRVKVYNHTGTILYNYDTGIDKGTISAVKRDDGKYYFVAGSCYFDIDGYIDNLSCERVVLNLKQRTKDHNFNLDFNGDGADDLLTGYGIAKLIEEVKWTYPELSPTIENSYMKLVGGATGAGSQRAVSNPSFSTDRSLRLKAKIVSEASTLLFGWVDEYDVHQEVAWHRTGSTEETATRHGGTEEDNTYDYLLDEKIYDIHRNSSTSVIFKRDDTTLFTHITQIPTGDLKAYIYTANGDEIWIDWILVRKYAATEPSASVGAEEEGNTAPSATFDNDFSTWQSGDITVNYNLIDAESDTCNISQTASSGIEYSTDNATWFDATEGTGGDGMTGLTSSASPGTDHSFVWASATDLADIEDSTVWLRIRPNDGTVDADAWVSSNSFGVDNIAPTITPVLNDTDGYVNSAETSTGIDILITTTGVEDGLTVTCNIKDVGDAHTVGPVTGDITSNAVTIASTALTTLDDGTITVSCDVSDAAGNPAPQGSDTSVKDVLAPSNIGVFSITANSSSQLTITTQTALDTGSGLNTAPYWFQETSGNTGASSSSEWQTLTEFIDDGLSSNTQYTYQVKAKDTAGNESGYSDSSSKYTLSCGGGGGGLPPAAYNPPASPSPSPQNPQGEFKVLINDNAEYANNLEVSLTLLAGKDTKRMAISNFSDFRNASQIPYQKEIEWNLCSSDLCLEGEYTVYVKFYTQWGQRSEIVSDNIIYRKEVPKPPEIEKPEKEPEIIEPSIEEPEIEKPEVPEEPEEPEEKKIPSGELPSALEQLPEYIKEIAQKFSPIKDIFVKLKIRTQQDLERLKNVKLTIPNLKELISLEKPELKPEIFFQEPVKPEIKEIIPEDTLFFTSSEDKIHINTELTSLDKEKPEQEVNLVSGHIIKVIVKPSSSVKSIKAQFTLREKSQSINSNPKHSFSDLFVSSVLAQNADTRFVLAEFELTDPDEDGIYTAEFQSPLVAGEYELIALLDFEDEDIQNKELRVITLVDPEGYIYTNLPQGEARIKDAEVFLYWLNTEKQAYQLWQADEYQQINPQITRQTGEYSFLVPEGTYYLKVEADRYLDFQTEPFEVKEGEGIHQNIELEKGFWQGLDWRIIAIVSLAIISTITLMLLLYNFYHDRKFRKKLEN